jgi:hypothetical protein
VTPIALHALVVGQETLRSSSADDGCVWMAQLLPFQ